MFDFCFAQNGLDAYKDGKKLASNSIKDFLKPEFLMKFINFTLKYIANLDIPLKRGTFIEFRTGMLNISPIGRNCSYDERLVFYEYDKEQKVREKMIAALKKEFPNSG